MRQNLRAGVGALDRGAFSAQPRSAYQGLANEALQQMGAVGGCPVGAWRVLGSPTILALGESAPTAEFGVRQPLISMPNSIYRNRAINAIRSAVQESRDAAAVMHAGLQGRIRELTVGSILEPFLPAGFEIGTGKVCDNAGGQSNETDVIISNRSVLPPILWSEKDGLFPIEAAYYAIEVKTTATATAMQDAINKGQAICELDFPGRDQRPSPHISPVVNAFFAYGTDLTTPHAELERYARLDASALTDPVVKAICVIGSGYWYFQRSRRAWVYHPATPKFDEVIDFVSGVVNSLLQQPPFERSGARLGYYLMLEKPERRAYYHPPLRLASEAEMGVPPAV